MSLAIIDSGGANIASVRFALLRLGVEADFTADPDAIGRADRVILPGVGAAAAAMARLHADGLFECIRSLTCPVLGICLGMQLLYEHSEEGDTPCLGIIPGRLARFAPSPGLRVPHMGWNRIQAVRDDPLTRGLDEGSWFYFVHSYYAAPNGHALARCEHGLSFAAMVRHRNFWGAQFHPERSATAGALVLRNFLAIECS